MKKIAINLVILCCVGSLSSCGQTIPNVRITPEQLESYKEIRQSFSNNIAEHFPELTDGKYFQYSSRKDDGNYVTRNCVFSNLDHIYLLIKLNRQKSKEVLEYAEKNAVRRYSFKEPCLMIVNRDFEVNEDFLPRDHPLRVHLKMCTTFDSSMLPVSNHKFCESDLMPSEFYEKATICVLGAEKGNFRTQNEKVRAITNVGLPNEWEHGYTRGVTVYKDYAAFWLEMW